VVKEACDFSVSLSFILKWLLSSLFLCFSL
jgi:hypothetical protein